MHNPVNALRGHSAWFWLILGLAVALRLWVATYNTSANDDHLEVIQQIKATGEMPVVGDCWQCYHVKAYHYPAAVLLSRLHVNNPVDQMRLLQYGNVLLGMLTLVLIWSWLRRRDIGEKWQLILFALIALNPRLAAINAEATNDSLVILAGTAAFLFYARFLETGRSRALWMALPAAGLAAASKASGLVVAILVLGHLAVYAALRLRRLPQSKAPATVSMLIIAALLLAVPYSGYVQNAREAGSALANNIETFPFPDWNEDNYWSEAGVTSITNSFFTFRWAGLIEYPYINKSPIVYPQHRTNHWAQLFGRHAFSRFDRWPPAWSTNGWWTTRVGQAAMILNIVPLGLLLAGLVSVAAYSVRRLWPASRLKAWFEDPEIFLVAAALALVAMSLKLSLDFQTFGIMKAIYLYPGLIGMVALLARGAAALQAYAPRMQASVRALLIALVTVHVADLGILATDLHDRFPAQVQKRAAFEPAPLGPGRIRLDRLAPVVPENERVGVNRSYSGRALSGGFQKYRFGFGVRAASYLRFRLDRRYAVFHTRMALADESTSTDGVRFEVWGDGRRLYEGPMLVDQQVDSVTLDVANINVLALRVHPLSSSQGDLANWLHPILVEKGAATRSNVDPLLQ